jgi:hypothetical protein
VSPVLTAAEAARHPLFNPQAYAAASASENVSETDRDDTLS